MLRMLEELSGRCCSRCGDGGGHKAAGASLNAERPRNHMHCAALARILYARERNVDVRCGGLDFGLVRQRQRLVQEIEIRRTNMQGILRKVLIDFAHARTVLLLDLGKEFSVHGGRPLRV